MTNQRDRKVAAFTAFSLFAGGGGACEGIRRAGGDVRLAVDFSPWAARTHRYNFPNSLFAQADVRALASNGSKFIALLNRARLDVGQSDLVHISSPCQPFSVAGRGVGDPSRESIHSGVRQTFASTLSFDAANLLHLARPKTGTFENVPGLAGQYMPILERILDSFRYFNGERNYYCAWEMMDAQSFGVPQRRKRLIAIFVRRDVAERRGIFSDDAVCEVFPRATFASPATVRQALQNLDQRRADEEVFFAATRNSSYVHMLDQLPPEPAKPLRLKNVKKNFSLVRCSWDHPAPTLTVTGQKPNALAGALHPSLDRKFSVPELKRLFGLPDEFIPMGTIEQAVDAICNMVPPALEEALARAIYERVLK